MTQQELDALPETDSLALWQEDDDPTSVTDIHGNVWMVGWAEGKKWKRLLR